MKKIYSLAMLTAVAAAALVSCSKEIEKQEVPQNEGIQITVVADDVMTKTALSGATSVVWTAGDKVGFINGADGVNVESSAAVIDGEGKATFTGTVASAGTYYAYYPYQADGSYAPDAEGVTVRILNAQNPTPTTFDPKTDLLVSEAFEATAGSYDTPTSIRFRRLGGFIRVKFNDGTTGTKLSGEYATTVSIESSDTRIVGRLKISGTSGLIDPNSGYKSITATYAADTYSLTASDQYAFFGVKPVTLPSGSTLTFTANTGNYDISKTVTLPSDVTIGSGDILPINVTLLDADVVAKAKATKIVKLWEKLSTAETNWMTAIGGTAGSDFNIAIDNANVYIPEFGSSKKIWAIDIATGSVVTSVNTSSVESVGFDGSIYLACARVVKKGDGTPVLMATNLFQDASETPTGRLYIWDEGVSSAPKVKSLQQWSAGRRLGDTWTTYGDYEDCWMLMGTQTGNGFVTFRVPTGDSASLISRLAIDTGDFCSYYPFPGDLLHGMFTWRGGTHDDGMAYRNRKMTVSSTEESIKTSGAHTSELTKLDTWMSNYENNNGSGFNFIEFNGKRYVIWVINMADSKTFDIVVKEGDTSTPWETIIDTPSATITSSGGFAFRESLVGGQAVTWKQGTDCAVWNNGDEVYIAVNKINVGIAVYKMYTE